ncbi:MAG: ExeM/NucH family extracellular endonuclease [Rhizobacter sp.]
MRLPLPRALAALLGLCLGAASASTSGVVISQVFGGNGSTYTRDYVELFNAGSAPVSISGWSVQYSSATGTGNFSANGITTLSGSLQPGQYHLVGLATAAGGATLPSVDASGTTNLSSSAGKVALVNTSTGLACNGGSTPCSAAQLAQIVDLVGYGSANYFEGAVAPALTATTALLRAGGGCTDTDNNAANFSSGTPAPRNSATPLAACGSGNQPVVASCPANVAVGNGVSVALALRASDADDVVSAASFVSGNVAGMSLTGFTASPAVGSNAMVNLSLSAAVPSGSYPVVVRFSNAAAQTGSCTVNVTVTAAAASFTPTFTLQGSGSTSPFLGQTVTTRGVVTLVNNNGYFIQDVTGDGNASTSDGLFVFTGSAPSVSAGQLVEVSGQISEFNTGAASNALTLAHTVTELTNSGTPLLLGTGSIAPTVVTLPEAVDGDLERYEGMLVTINTPLTVSQNYFQGRYGQVTLSAGGRLIKPTQLYRPGSAAALALADQNTRTSIILDDGSSLQNPSPIPYIGVDNTLRAGDTMPSLTGVVDYGLATADNTGLADWRIQPSVAPVITRANPRTAAPAAAGGNLKVASFNVLNYFTTFTDGHTAAGGSGQGCAPSNTTSDCRGADNAAEFTRQRDKIIAAISAMNADVVGLMEIQNNGTTAAQNLVDGLNAVMGANTYAVVPSPSTTGTDAIRVAMIYKPARVATVGASLADGSAIHNRPPMAQAFSLNVNSEKFSVIVNHFKSKGCTGAAGADADQGDGQGCFNDRRVQQAQALLSFIETVKTAAADPDVMVIGDLNAYGQEDPVFTLVSGGLVNQPLRFNATPYSYVFDGESGTIDHGLATPSLSPRVVGAAHWHINADEPVVIDYNTEFKPQDLYTATPYRASDHDPVVLSINLVPPQAQTISFASLGDVVLGAANFSVSASASSGLPVSLASQTTAVCTLSGNTVHIVAVGTCSIAATQAGDGNYLAAPTVVRSFAVKQAQTLSFAPLGSHGLSEGSLTLAATASSGLPVSYATNTPTFCTVSASTLTLLASGTCSVTATQAGNGVWAAASSVTQSFAVTTGAPADGDVPLPLWALGLLGAGLMAGVRRVKGRVAG